MINLDCRGLSCPEPVIMTKKALKDADELEVIVDNRVSMENISRYSRAVGIEPSVSEKDGEWTLILRK